MDVSSNLHAGEKSPDFAIKSRLDVSSRVPKVTSAAYDRSVYLAVLKEASFLKEYWSDAPKSVEAIQKHSEKAQRSKGELLLVDLLA